MNNAPILLAADTTRSRSYLQCMLKATLQPSLVILLKNPEADLKPGQLEGKDKEFSYKYAGFSFNPYIPLEETLELHRINYKTYYTNDPNAPEVCETLKCVPQDLVIYSGSGGRILRNEILSLGKKFLHCHPGKVPEFRGSTPIYYSILQERQMAVSAFILAPQIDTGPLIKIKTFPLPAPSQMKDIDFFIDPLIRTNLLIEVLTEYTQSGQLDITTQSSRNPETFYIIHPLLKHIAILANNE